MRRFSVVVVFLATCGLLGAADDSPPGAYLTRTMALLESSTPEHRTPVKILFYGQSIIGQGYADRAILKFLREKYPHAAITSTNSAIGGYQAPVLRRTAWQDLYNQNPDLVVFHVYGGEKGELEEIFKGMKEHLTAEVLTWTHHVDSTPDEGNGRNGTASELIKSLAAKYSYEVADVRSFWQKTIQDKKITSQDLMVDSIHLNERGGALLGEAVVARFQKTDADDAAWRERVHTVSLADANANVTYEPGTWKVENGGLISNGTAPLRVEFTGNRIDLAGLAGTGGKAKILLDGKVPSAQRDTLAAGRSSLAPGAWWPVLTQIKVGENAMPQKYKVSFSNVAPDGSSYTYRVRGLISGEEGEGKFGEPFQAKSRQISFEAWDIALATVKKITSKDLPPSFDAEFPIYSMSKDEWRSPTSIVPGKVLLDTVVRCWTDGPHVLEIIPKGDGPVGIRDLVIYSPAGKAAP